MIDPARPYNDLPLLPPNAEIETRVVLKKCVAARTALAELRLAGQLIPDQSVLVHAIPNLEARDSSAVENIVTTNDALFREASLGDHEATPATKEAARYRNALYMAIEAIKTRPLSARVAVEVCRAITGIDLDIRRTPGTTLANSHTGEVIYTPPEGEARLRELLANWERFAHESPDIDPLVRMAVLHYQFEAIHPFPDGNGRTGRILNVLGLMQEGLLDLPTLYLSRYILETRGEYYHRLGEVTFQQKWEPWVLYILNGVEQTSAWTTQKIRAIRALMNETTRYVRAVAPKLPHAVIEQIFTRPYCRIANLVEAKIAARHTASAYLKELVSLGILEEEKVGRDKIFLHRKYIDVLFGDGHTFKPYPRQGARAMEELHLVPLLPGDRVTWQPTVPRRVHVRSVDGTSVTLIVGDDDRAKLEALVAEANDDEWGWLGKWPVHTDRGPRLVLLTQPWANAIWGVLQSA